jgi:hypothetical protein
LKIDNATNKDCKASPRKKEGFLTIKDMRGNLTPGVGERVKRLVDLLLQDLELNGHHGRDEDIVQGLSLDADIELLHTVGHAADHLFDAADETSKTWRSEPFEFSKGFDDSYLGGGNCEGYL